MLRRRLPFGLDFRYLLCANSEAMDDPINKMTRSEERDALIEKWQQRLHPVFLDLGLDVCEFWQRWDSGSRKDVQESGRDVKALGEMVILTMHKAAFDTRLDSLEALADDHAE